MTVAPIRRQFAAMLRDAISPVRRSLRQFLAEDIWLPDGPRKGEPFRFETQPFTGLLVDEIDSGRWPEIFVAGPSQSGKTLIGHVVPPVWVVSELRRNIVVAMPDMRMVTNKWTVDFQPVFEASPKLRDLLPTSGPGSRGGTIKDTVKLTNGAIIKFMTAGGDDTSRAGFTAEGGVFGTEAARFSHAGEASVESDPLDQLRARMQSMQRHERRLIVEGTLTTEAEYPWRAREHSTQSQILTPCPHCHKWIAPGREHLVGWEDARSEIEAGEKAWWSCPACGQDITDDERAAANRAAKLVHIGQSIDRRGRVVGAPPQTERLWFHWSAWHNLLLNARDLAPDLWKAARLEPESEAAELAERKLSQFVFSVPYTSPSLVVEAMQPGDVARNAAELPKGDCPSDTRWLTVACDVGMYLLHWVVIAWRRNGGAHVCDYETIPVLTKGEDTASGRKAALNKRLREALDVLRNRCSTGWGGSQGRIAPDRILIDAKYFSNTVHGWCLAAAAKGLPFFPSIGYGTAQGDGRKYSHPGKKTNEIRYVGENYHLKRHRVHRTMAFHNDADFWKSRVHRMLKVEPEQAGCLTLFSDPQYSHRTFERHLLAEHMERKPHPKHGSVDVWVNPGDKPNHFGDATYMACVGGHHAGFRFEGAPDDEATTPLVRAAAVVSKVVAAAAAAKRPGNAPRKWLSK